MRANRSIKRNPDIIQGRFHGLVPYYLQLMTDLLCEQRRGVVPVPAVREQGNDDLAFVLRTLRQFDGAMQRRTG